MVERESFGSNAAAVLALAGSAIGLGNIWRFPYIVGQNGGAAFIIVYLAVSFFLAFPIFMSEAVIGRKSKSNTFGAMQKLAPGSRWKWMGLVTVITPMIIMSYYSVVGGWSVEYLFKSLFGGFVSSVPEAASVEFGTFISSTGAPLLCHTVFLLLCALIVTAGVKSGIEKFSKITMPLLLVLIIVIMIYSISLPGASQGVEYLLKPDFSKLTPSAIASAMGQSFFSLSLGVGTVLTYSSYIKKNENLLGSGLGTAGFDILFALIAGFAVMPAVFAAGIEPASGPGLVFETLPFIFAKMGSFSPVLSSVVAVLFFLTILVAALTSAISMYEVGVAYLVEEKKLSRRKAVLVILAASWTLGALCSLSFGRLADFKILGETIFNFCDKLTSNYLMVFGSLLFVIFAGWKMDKSAVRDEFTNNGSLRGNARIFDALYFLMKYVAPIVILIIFFTNFA